MPSAGLLPLAALHARALFAKDDRPDRVGEKWSRNAGRSKNDESTRKTKVPGLGAIPIRWRERRGGYYFPGRGEKILKAFERRAFVVKAKEADERLFRHSLSSPDTGPFLPSKI